MTEDWNPKIIVVENPYSKDARVVDSFNIDDKTSAQALVEMIKTEHNIDVKIFKEIEEEEV